MRRIWLAAIAIALLVSVLGVALLQHNDGAQAQATKTPVLVMEVASWAKGDVDPTAWQWQALESGALHVAFWSPGKMACAEIAKVKTATVAGPGDAVEMCEALFSRANG